MDSPLAKVERHSLWHHVIDMFVPATCLIVADTDKFRAFLKETEPGKCREWLDGIMGDNTPIDIVISNYDFVESEKPFAHNLMKDFVRGMNEKYDGTTYCKNILYILSNMRQHVIDSILKYDLDKVYTISPEMYQDFLNLAGKKGGKRSITRKNKHRKMRKGRANKSKSKKQNGHL